MSFEKNLIRVFVQYEKVVQGVMTLDWIGKNKMANHQDNRMQSVETRFY